MGAAALVESRYTADLRPAVLAAEQVRWRGGLPASVGGEYCRSPGDRQELVWALDGAFAGTPRLLAPDRLRQVGVWPTQSTWSHEIGYHGAWQA